MNENKQFKRLLNDFNVKTEDELFEKMVEESKTIPCIECGIETNIEMLSFPDGEPVCLNCMENYS